MTYSKTLSSKWEVATPEQIGRLEEGLDKFIDDRAIMVSKGDGIPEEHL